MSAKACQPTDEKEKLEVADALHDVLVAFFNRDTSLTETRMMSSGFDDANCHLQKPDPHRAVLMTFVGETLTLVAKLPLLHGPHNSLPIEDAMNVMRETMDPAEPYLLLVRVDRNSNSPKWAVIQICPPNVDPAWRILYSKARGFWENYTNLCMNVTEYSATDKAEVDYGLFKKTQKSVASLAPIRGRFERLLVSELSASSIAPRRRGERQPDIV